MDKRTEQKVKSFVNAVRRITQENPETEVYWYLKEGTKVKINMERILKGNSKRYQWCLEHQDEIFTIEYDENHLNKPTIYCLKEDTSDPKWLFALVDLIVLDEMN